MEIPLIDTLEVAEELEGLGFPEQQAKGLVRVIGRQFNERIVTKEFLRQELERFATKEDLRKGLKQFATEQDKKLAKMETRLLIWMLSAIGVATTIISLVSAYVH